MFRDRITTSPFLIQNFTGEMDNSFTPKIGDVASITVDKNNIQISVILERNDGTNWEGKIISYHPEVTKLTPEERLEEIKSNEAFINGNNLTNGSNVSFKENMIHSLHRS